MPFTCASPLRSVWIGAGVGGKVSHLSAASAGRTARTRVGASRNGRMSFSLWASNYLSAFRLWTSLTSRYLQTPFPSLTDSVAKLPKCRATNFSQKDETSCDRRSIQPQTHHRVSPVSSSQDDVVPHMIIRSPRPGSAEALRCQAQLRRGIDDGPALKLRAKRPSRGAAKVDER